MSSARDSAPSGAALSSATGSRDVSPADRLDRERVAGRVRVTRLERALDWAASLAPSPLTVGTSCCGMSLSGAGNFFEALGTAPPASSARAADLMIVAGSITRRQVPLLLDLYDRMVSPRWIMAWGACAIAGGPYDNYAVVPGLSRILPVDVHVAGCPPAPVDLREALDCLRERAERGGGARTSSDEGWLPIREHGPSSRRA